MVTRTSPFAKNLEKLEVLMLCHALIRVRKPDFDYTLLRCMRSTILWVQDNLTNRSGILFIRNFRIPLRSLVLSQFRAFYVQAFRYGSEANVPIEILRARADLAADALISRIERDLKESWRRTGYDSVSLVRVTKEVFSNVIS